MSADHCIADALYRKLKTGSFAPPKLSVGAQGSVGLGPLSLGGKIGLGAGGYPGEGELAYYQPLSEQPGLDHHVAGELGLGAGVTSLNVGAGVGAALDDTYTLPSLSVPRFGVPQFIRSVFIIVMDRKYYVEHVTGTFPDISVRFLATSPVSDSVVMTMFSMWSMTPATTRAGSPCPSPQAGVCPVCQAFQAFPASQLSPPSPVTWSRSRLVWEPGLWMSTLDWEQADKTAPDSLR